MQNKFNFKEHGKYDRQSYKNTLFTYLPEIDGQIDFYRSDFRGSKFYKLNISANFDRADFMGCSFQSVNFIDTSFGAPQFKNCIFENVVFRNNRYNATVFIKCSFLNCKFDEESIYSNFTECSFNKTEFENLNFEIKKGERVAIIGGNGTGKTTLLKIINGIAPADTGKVTLGANVEIGYYDQEHQVLHYDKSLFDEISDDYPYLTNTEIRNVLASFLFTKDDVFKLVGSLSGGEKGRVSLAKLMLSEANFLLLDEPTNHLDITSKEILEDALNNYEGTVLFVSHDRYFINKTATRILDLTGKRLINYIGNYDYYLEKKETLEAALLDELPKEDQPLAASANKQNWQTKKEEQKELRKIQNELKRIEDEVAKLEETNARLDEELANPEIAANVGKLMEVHKQKEANDERINALLERWEELSENV